MRKGIQEEHTHAVLLLQVLRFEPAPPNGQTALAQAGEIRRDRRAAMGAAKTEKNAHAKAPAICDRTRTE